MWSSVILLKTTRFNQLRRSSCSNGELSEEQPGFVSVVAMVETAWVLERVYSLTGEELAAAIERILEVNVLIVESEQEVFTAMIAVKEGRGSFADALIGALGTKVGCSHTVTFDQKAPRLPAFRRV